MRTQRIGAGKFAGIITVRGGLNYEESSRYVLVLQAEDSAKAPETSLTSSVTVVVDVLDVQDQPPVFLNAPYRTVIQENSPAGQQLMKVLVRDGDTGQPRAIQLDIIDDPFGYFRVDSFKMSDDVATANIVTTDVFIDRENGVILRRGGVYSFALKVRLKKTPTELCERSVALMFSSLLSRPLNLLATNQRRISLSRT